MTENIDAQLLRDLLNEILVVAFKKDVDNSDLRLSTVELSTLEIKIKEKVGFTVSKPTLEKYFSLAQTKGEIEFKRVDKLDTLTRYLEEEVVKTKKRRDGDYSSWIKFRDKWYNDRSLEEKKSPNDSPPSEQESEDERTNASESPAPEKRRSKKEILSFTAIFLVTITLLVFIIAMTSNRSEKISDWDSFVLALLPKEAFESSEVRVSEFLLGHFDNDKHLDIFSVREDFWCGCKKWSFYSSQDSLWKEITESQIPLADLQLGDFNGDSITDILIWNNGKGKYFDVTSSHWVELFDITTFDLAGMSELRFGNFDEEKETDVFSKRLSDNRWVFSSGGVTNWIELGGSDNPIDRLRFVDINGDDYLDIFTIKGRLSVSDQKKWHYAENPKKPWKVLNGPYVPLDSIRFFDCDGDGKTDVMRFIDNEVWYSKEGNTDWIKLENSSQFLQGNQLSDFDADGTTDIFHTGF